MTWADGLLVPYDCESTGVDVETDRIVTATVLYAHGPDPVVQQWLTDPGIPIPEGAQAIHGITTAHAQAHGRPPAEVVDEIGSAIRAGWTAGGVLCGFNLSYDLTMLDREHRRHLGRPFVVSGPIADAFVLDKVVDKYRKGSRRLGAVAEHYQVQSGTAHDATSDALAAARICWRIAREFHAIGEMEPREELYSVQVKAKAEQASGLQDHLRRKAHDAGKSVADIEAIVVDPFWPIKPVPTAAAATTEEQGTLL